MEEQITWIVMLLSFGLPLCLCSGNMQRQEILHFLMGLAKDKKELKYDSSIAPDFELDTPTRVKLQILIQNIYSVSEAFMDYSMDIFLKQTWEDKRLNYENMSTSPWLEMDSKMMDKVWVPDTYFSNEKKANVHDVTVPNKMMHLYRNGTIVYSSRLSLTLSCGMNLQKYPLDEQICPIFIESFAYTIDNVVYEWEEISPVKILNNLTMAQFQGSVYSTERKQCHQSHAQNSFACLQAYIQLRRKVGYYLVQVFVPSTLVVVLSWVSFWVDHDAVPARVVLGVLTVLTITTQSSGAKQSLPLVSYVKAIDVWMFTCLLFVFSALIEYAYLHVVARRAGNRLKRRAWELQRLTQSGPAENSPAIKSVEIQKGSKIAARKVDKISRLLFPGCFLSFNIIFWTYYYFAP